MIPTPSPEGCGGCLAYVLIAVAVGVAAAFVLVGVVAALFGA